MMRTQCDEVIVWLLWDSLNFLFYFILYFWWFKNNLDTFGGRQSYKCGEARTYGEKLIRVGDELKGKEKQI